MCVCGGGGVEGSRGRGEVTVGAGAQGIGGWRVTGDGRRQGGRGERSRTGEN